MSLDGDIQQWLSSKFTGEWQVEHVAGALTDSILERIAMRFAELDTAVQIQVLVALACLEAGQAQALREGVARVLASADAEEQEWVRVVAGLVWATSPAGHAAAGAHEAVTDTSAWAGMRESLDRACDLFVAKLEEAGLAEVSVRETLRLLPLELSAASSEMLPAPFRDEALGELPAQCEVDEAALAALVQELESADSGSQAEVAVKRPPFPRSRPEPPPMRPGVPSSAVGALAPSGTGSGAPHKVRLLDETEAGRLLQAKQREHAEAERRRKEEAERRKQELHQRRTAEREEARKRKRQHLQSTSPSAAASTAASSAETAAAAPVPAPSAPALALPVPPPAPAPAPALAGAAGARPAAAATSVAPGATVATPATQSTAPAAASAVSQLLASASPEALEAAEATLRGAIGTKDNLLQPEGRQQLLAFFCGLPTNPRPERGQQQRILVHEQPVLDRKTGAMVAVNQFYIQLDYESLGWQFGKAKVRR